MPPESQSERDRLLVVDDEPLNRELLRRVLHQEYEIEEAEDAATAIKILEAEEAFRVILCDQLMPGRSGSDLAQEVKVRWPQTAFLLITGYDDDPQVVEARARGLVRDVVTKPWSARGLKSLLRSVLDEPNDEPANRPD
jgi:two-component system, NtrC family, response regulator HupR/HoxA